jgi:hypothetical protein
MAEAAPGAWRSTAMENKRLRRTWRMPSDK